jgi:hypothetical protein
MYIVTFIQSDSNNIDSNLCSTSKEVLKAIKRFFQDSLIVGFEEFKAIAKEQMVSKADFTMEVSLYTTIHVQALNSYSRQQLLLVDQEKPLAPIKPYKITLCFTNGEPTVTRIYESLEEAKICFTIFYGRRPKDSDIELKADGWEEEKPQEPLKPFVVAATLPDNTEVVLRRFDNEADQKMFESNCYISHWQECKCGVCGKVLGDESDVFVDHYSPALLCVNHSRFNDSIEAYEATEGDLEYRKRTVKVVLEDDDSYETPIYGTKKIVEDYFAIGSTLNMGVAEDRMVAIKELIFLS